LTPANADPASGGDDPSVKIWNLALAHAKEHDADMVERWKGDMDGILIYVRFIAVRDVWNITYLCGKRY
jgi:Family of unknown function (DUF6535)